MPRTRTYGLDIDTIRFAQKVKQGSGTTILPEPLKQVNKFVVGLKKLRLWDSMVCWPMRSIHNAGTGSTVYSLGSFGDFNGTLFNSPSWGIDGIVNSSTGRIDTNLTINGGNQAHIFVGNSTSASATRCYGGTLSTSNTRGTRFRDDAILWGDGSLRQWNLSLSSIGNFKMAAALYNRPETMYGFLNTTQNNFTAYGAPLAGTNNLSLLNARDLGSSSQFYSGQTALYLVLIKKIQPEQYIAIYNLYKMTMGKGLNLP